MRKKSINFSNNQQKVCRQTAYHRGNQRESSPNYVLLYSDGEYSGDEESIPLSKRNYDRSQPRKVEVIEVRLKSEDTLQALALRFGCTISELKRINKIHKDNEIHAHRSIKVPIPPFSILTETLKNEQEKEQKEEADRPKDAAVSSREDEIINLISTPIVNVLPQTEINNIILNSVCEPLSNYQDNSECIGATERDMLLSNAESGSVENLNSNLTDNFRCSGADWGISWLQLLGVSLLLGFAGPLIYLLYLSESSSKRRLTLGH